MLLVTQIK